MEKRKNKTIRSFHDLRVYQSLYKAMVIVLTKIVPKLPREEKYDLVDQMRRCCKAGPSLFQLKVLLKGIRQETGGNT